MTEEPKWTNWTKGPWGQDWNAPSIIIAENGSGRTICKVLRFGPEDDANLRLIAAAPDMAELLEDWLTAWDSWNESVQVIIGRQPGADVPLERARNLLNRIHGENG